MRRLFSTVALAVLAAGVAQAQISQEVSDDAEQAGADNKKPYAIRGIAELRTKAISDQDPANDRMIVWRGRVTVDAFKNADVLVDTGLVQRFVAEEGDSSLRMLDTFAGFSYNTPLELGSKTLNLNHQLRLYLPTSRASRTQDLYLAPMLYELASMEVASGIQLYVLPYYRQRFHKYAERAGAEGGVNVQIEMHARFGADAELIKLHGPISVGASAGSTWYKFYASREDYESSASDQTLWAQDYDWEAHLGYTPWKYIDFTLAIEQGGPVLRDGIVNTFFVKREETEMVLYLTGRY